MNIPKKVEVKYHYDRKDKDCNEDYYNVDICFDRVPVLSLDDEYHDGSSRQVEGFLTACKLIWGEQFPEPIVTNKNDSKR